MSLYFDWAAGGWKFALGLTLAIGFGNSQLEAAVATVGNVTPVPPVGGGAIAGPFTVGNISFGSVHVGGGTAISSTNAAIVGDADTGIGIVSLSGFGSNWTLTSNAADLTVGDAGIGTVTVSNSAVLTVNDDTFLGLTATGMGRATVTDLGSVWDNGDDMAIGSSGVGILEVLNGGQLISDSATLGSSATGQGRVIVAGELSRWQLNSSTIGSSGFGSVSVSEAGRIVSNSSVLLANTAASRAEVLVDGIGSQWNIAGSFTTSLGDANVTLANGGRITTTSPSTIASAGRITLAGGRWDYSAAETNSILLLGLLQGSGTLDMPGVSVGLSGSIRGRMHTNSGDHLLLTGLLSNTGVVDLDDGELEVRGTVTNNFRIDARNGAVLRSGSTGLVNNSTAQLAITGGAVDVFGNVNNMANAEIAVVGKSIGVFHDTVTNNGTIFVSPGSELVMLQDLGFSSISTFNVGLAAVDADDEPTDGYGQAIASGDAFLAGTLNVSLAEGFAPSLGDAFQIVSASGDRTGVFATENLPPLSAGLNWELLYGPNSLTLLVTGSGVPGDYNNDGVVNAADYVVWRNALGSATSLPNDSTLGVGLDDFAQWKNNFGAESGSGAEQTSVPEPTTALHLLAAVLVLAAFPQRFAARLTATA